MFYLTKDKRRARQNKSTNTRLSLVVYISPMCMATLLLFLLSSPTHFETQNSLQYYAPAKISSPPQKKKNNNNNKPTKKAFGTNISPGLIIGILRYFVTLYFRAFVAILKSWSLNSGDFIGKISRFSPSVGVRY